MELLEIGSKPHSINYDILYTVYSNYLHVTSMKLTYCVYSSVPNPHIVWYGRAHFAMILTWFTP